ncbi:MAG: sigma 54-interacting transcriptional regulator [Deltaproteobacteria bacterium]|nr:sigma 54-interacting transcriptional regulator [Deltaproteobacteria bacterium]
MKSKNHMQIMELLLDNAHEGLVICDPEGKILYFNRSYASIYNMKKEHDFGKNIEEFFPNSRIRQAAKTGEPEYGVINYWKGRKVVVNRIPIKEGSRVKYVVSQILFRDIEDLQKMAEKLTRLQNKIERMGAEIRNIFQAKYTIGDIIGESYQSRQLKKQAGKFASSSLPILILGESGTGKELFAQAIHMMSPRAERAFLPINCAAIPKELMESELFGYEAGAFTGATQKGKIGKFEIVEGGTLFLDEIGDMPLEMQSKLLRVLEEKQITRLGGSRTIPVEFSLIASTNRNVEDMVGKGTFRSDLFYRINVFVLKIPPLRDRREDILTIAQNIAVSSLSEFSDRDIADVTFSREVSSLLIRHDWPGNVRELKNVVNYAIHNLLPGESIIESKHLPASLSGKREMPPSDPATMLFREGIEKKEREIIADALKSTTGNKLAAARLLGMPRSVLYKKIKKYDITV